MGNTYPIKDRLRDAGCHWDRDERAWWTSKASVAEKFAGSTPKTSEGASGALDKQALVRGKVTYKGKTYLLLWSGDTKRGPAAKLAFRDGSKVFWADLNQVTITKQYQHPKSGGSGHSSRRYVCDECGEWVTPGTPCWETGCTH